MRAGFLLDRLVALDRNRGVPPLAPPAGRTRRLAQPKPSSAFPGSARQGLTGAAVWYDYVTTGVRSADVRLGAGRGRSTAPSLANHVEAVAPLVDGAAA